MAVKTAPPPTRSLQTPNALALFELRGYQGSGGVTGGATLSSALDALNANRVRSFLTMLGIIIGVSAVIAVVALAQGVTQNINANFASLGTNILTISPGTTQSGGALTAAGSSETLTQGDANAIAQLSTVANVSPIINANEQVVYQDNNWNTSVRGVYPTYQQINNWQLAEGSWFSQQAENQGESVAVIGATTAQELFPEGTDPVGKTIRAGTALFTVIGVLQSKGSSGGANSDDVIFVPFTAAYNHLNTSNYVSQIQVQVDSTKDLTLATQQITYLLRQRHHLYGPDPSATSTSTQRSSSLFGGAGGRGPGGPGSGPGGPGGGGPGGGGPGGGGNQGNTTNARAGSNSSTGASAGSKSSYSSSSRTVGEANDFQIFNVESIIESAQQSSAMLEILLVGIAAISLAVGGIGIMNIMLVSVTERTREIGIRMAIGARRRDVRNQFLTEAMMLCAAGGIVGIILGMGGGFALTAGLHLPYVLTPYPALIAFVVSSAVGIVFGYYPAARASKLDPIIALRTE
jgi:ABC-type antimicrobial peptide transport system permease subunit